MSADSQPDLASLARERMVRLQLRARGIRDARVLTAMARVRRHEFVPAEYASQAYEDHPLPIGNGQTISQPFIVALMLEHLAIEPWYKVLEVGTGSGYVTALLAELAAEVYSIERHRALAESAAQRLKRLGYHNVQVRAGDGSQGLPPSAPFDAIMVSAAAFSVPAPLFQQLREGGRLIIPIGPQESQELRLVTKLEGNPQITNLEGCRFVPLVSDSDPSHE